MLKHMAFKFLLAIGFIFAGTSVGLGNSPSTENAKSKPVIVAPLSNEDQSALELGRKVLAISQAIQNPKMPNAMKTITDLGLETSHYAMVRGWLSYQLQGDMSIFEASGELTPKPVMERIEFLKRAIRAIDLE